MATTQPSLRWSALPAPPPHEGPPDLPAIAMRPVPESRELVHFISRDRRLQAESDLRPPDLLDSLGAFAPCTNGWGRGASCPALATA